MADNIIIISCTQYADHWSTSATQTTLPSSNAAAIVTDLVPPAMPAHGGLISRERETSRETCIGLSGPTPRCLPPEKTYLPNTTMTFLGIELDTVRKEARLPLDKLCKSIPHVVFQIMAQLDHDLECPKRDRANGGQVSTVACELYHAVAVLCAGVYV
ncbi:hypothetical protein Bbelb_391540 [Branchiostoma belcheri]|nr:hypothetical protein Bbelb_391540 [Branchiostoma belcheri]